MRFSFITRLFSSLRREKPPNMCVSWYGQFAGCKHIFYVLQQRCGMCRSSGFSEATRPHDWTCMNFRIIPYPSRNTADDLVNRQCQPGICCVCLRGRLEEEVRNIRNPVKKHDVGRSLIYHSRLICVLIRSRLAENKVN